MDGACGNRQQGGEAGYDEAAANGSRAVKLVTMKLRQTAAGDEAGYDGAAANGSGAVKLVMMKLQQTAAGR